MHEFNRQYRPARVSQSHLKGTCSMRSAAICPVTSAADKWSHSSLLSSSKMLSSASGESPAAGGGGRGEKRDMDAARTGRRGYLKGDGVNGHETIGLWP